MTLIDLSMTLSASTPVYPGDPSVVITVAAQMEADGFLDHSLALGTHNGTHIDAAGHMVPGGKMLDDYPLDQFVGRGVLVDARDGVDADQLRKQEISRGDMVLIWTGISDSLYSENYYERDPQVSQDAAEYLVSKGVNLVAVDAGSIDASPFPIHKTLLSGGVLLAENLVGLSQLQNATFEVWALPLNLQVEAAPARVVARILP
ncbi:cyclase family protein [Streptomyces beijiangensis]|uniref:Cyclase family protein n=1 Tax=Streptomyces beijiangensis TaxID=163361 RepID=A0A939F6R2_9ACTN|nr:cyclase family protein [Streptomyces beijiangensis]MBO0512953.1 cyclase family protein [Streptomyces beijiangensis]